MSSQSNANRLNQAPSVLVDGFQRKLTYVRLSVTDFCNFKCDYCLPKGYYANQGKRSKRELSLPEIRNLLNSLANLGTKKIRITGGEPSIRQDLTDIIDMASHTQGIEMVAMSSNGYRLGKHYKAWLDAGLDQLNISIDSFDPSIFHAITGHDVLEQLLADIDVLLSDVSKSGRKPFSLKINALLKASTVYDNLNAALDYVKTRAVTYRFIEFMQTSDNSHLFFAEHDNVSRIRQFLESNGWHQDARLQTAGPAIEYSHPEYRGKIGFIAPYSPTFCDDCNRLRISAHGKLHLCLFDHVNHDLRPYLASHDEQELQAVIADLVKIKPKQHHLHEHNSGMMKNLSIVGG